MSAKESNPRIESKWASVLEYSVFGFPAIIAIGFLFAVVPFGGSTSSVGFYPKLLGALLLVSLVGGLALTVLVAVSLYFDARKVRSADAAWNPSPALYGVGGLLLSGLVALHYLYERYEHTAAAPAWDNWWYGVVACLTVVVVAGATAVLPISTTMGMAAGIVVSASVLPIAIYKDAVSVRASGGDWLPNPVNYFLAVFVGSFLLVVPAVVSGYYLYKRHKHVGVP